MINNGKRLVNAYYKTGAEEHGIDWRLFWKEGAAIGGMLVALYLMLIACDRFF